VRGIPIELDNEVFGMPPLI
jgi:hypothetical protein